MRKHGVGLIAIAMNATERFHCRRWRRRNREGSSMQDEDWRETGRFEQRDPENLPEDCMPHAAAAYALCEQILNAIEEKDVHFQIAFNGLLNALALLCLKHSDPNRAAEAAASVLVKHVATNHHSTAQ
jgi:hypothetical protein